MPAFLHFADVIKAASASRLSFICLVFLLLSALIHQLLRKENRKVKVGALGGFVLLFILILGFIAYWAPVPAAPRSVSQPTMQSGQTNVNAGNVTQSGSVNINGVGGNVTVQNDSPHQSNPRKAR
jgi:hypothetical protein